MNTGRSSKPPEYTFFTVMLGDFHEKLRLPRRFVEVISPSEEWQTATIWSTPLSETWKVDALKNENHWSFTGPAWKGFVQAHNLQTGCILIFSYEGEAVFTVDVFDVHTFCLKNYNKNTTEEDDVDVQDINMPNEHVTHNKKGNARESIVKKNSRKTTLTGWQSELTIRIANPSFLPCEYVRENAIWGIPRVWLTNTEGCWPVELHHQYVAHQRRTWFGSGWTRFKRVNNMSNGDMCMLKLSHKTEKYIIFLVNRKNMISEEQDEHDPIIGSYNTNQQNSKRMVVDGSKLKELLDKSINPMSSKGVSVKRKYKHIPKRFEGYDYLFSKNEVKLKDTQGRSWLVGIKCKIDNNLPYLRLCRGWKSFIHDKQLQVGDVCIFELVTNQKGATMFVKIQKTKVLSG